MEKLKDELLKKIVNMFSPCDRDFLEFKKEDVIVGPNDRAIIGWDNYFPKKWLVEDYGFTEEEASAFIDMVNREARHGVWEMIPPPKGHRAGAYVKFRCSECGTEYESSGRYCPNCWARMDGKEKTDDES